MSVKRSIEGKVKETVPKFPEVPGILKDAFPVWAGTLDELPDPEALTTWLNENGLDTSDWGKGNTKEVKKFWGEIRDKESGVELWRKADDSVHCVRTTHVLRAKVCSPDSFKRGVFLFNTWQQYGDGRRRVRNGLLSEKLTLEEMPLEEHLEEVCERAVTQEEMQRLADPLLKIGPGSPAPEYDSNYVCPLRVVDQFFVDHVIEVEVSKSYPRLLTMYHLYTVDIVCTGLPLADFNTLEFDHPEGSVKRPLKYVHAWVWMQWSEIQRYLFEGSTMKERKKKGSFTSSEDLKGWLELFNLDLEVWGEGHFKSVDNLFEELEAEESHLELWGREDGVPLVMRVVHVLQLKVCSTDHRMQGKFIYHTWTQKRDGRHKVVNRLMTKVLRIENASLNRAKLVADAETVVRQQLSYTMDPHFRLEPDKPPDVESLEAGQMSLRKVTFQDHRVDVDNSPTFKGLCTLYHLYTCEVECDGLPHANFATVEVRRPNEIAKTASSLSAKATGPYVHGVHGWCWVVLPQCMDMAHSRNLELEEQLDSQKKAIEMQDRLIHSKAEAIDSMMNDVLDIVNDPKVKVPKQVSKKVRQLLDENREREAAALKKASEINLTVNTNHVSRRLPPSMVSEMAEGALVSDDLFVNQAQVKEWDADVVTERKHCSFPWCGFSISC
jgi:hypothetical protein